METDGYSLDDKREKIDKNDIPDILKRFNNLKEEEKRERTDKSFLVPVEEIIENDYDLSINRYKEIIYEEVEYDTPENIIQEIKVLEDNIIESLNNLENMVK